MLLCSAAGNGLARTEERGRKAGPTTPDDELAIPRNNESSSSVANELERILERPSEGIWNVQLL